MPQDPGPAGGPEGTPGLQGPPSPSRAASARGSASQKPELEAREHYPRCGQGPTHLSKATLRVSRWVETMGEVRRLATCSSLGRMVASSASGSCSVSPSVSVCTNCRSWSTSITKAPASASRRGGVRGTNKCQDQTVARGLSCCPQPPPATGCGRGLWTPSTPASIYTSGDRDRGPHCPHEPRESLGALVCCVPAGSPPELTLALEDEAPPAALPGHVLKSQEAGVHPQVLTPLPHAIHVTRAHLGHEGHCRRHRGHQGSFPTAPAQAPESQEVPTHPSW